MTGLKTEEGQDDGHYRSAGLALLGMGMIAGLLGYLVGRMQIESGFIDLNGILGIGITFFAVGALMVAVDSREGE